MFAVLGCFKVVFNNDIILEVYEEDVGDSSSEYDEDEDQVDDQLEDQDSRNADPSYLKPRFLSIIPPKIIHALWGL